MKLSPTIAARFFGNIKANMARTWGGTPCMEWQRATNNVGYGMMSVAASVSRPVHRVSWFLHTGVWPELKVLHHCDNPPCGNFLHLFLGTQQDNRQDAKQKDRVAFGERHGMTKLSAKDVAAIRELRAAGSTLKQLSAAYNTCQSNVSSIVRGLTRQRER